MKHNRTLAWLAGLTLTLAAILPLSAATLTWTDGAGNFIWNTTSANWTTGGGNIPWANGNDAILGSNGVGAITVAGTQTVTSLTVSAAGYSLTGGQIYLASETVFQISNNITIGSVIGGNSLYKYGAGILTFTNQNTYTGRTTVAEGGLVLSAGALGVGIVRGQADIFPGATMTLQGNTNQSSFPTAGSDTINIYSTSTSASGIGTLAVAGASGANGYNQATYGGTINLIGNFGGSANVTTPDNSMLLFQGGNGGVVNSIGAGTNSFAVNIGLKNNGGGTCTFYAAPTNTLSVSGAISDFPGYAGNPLLYTGGGLIPVTGNNSYGGPTTVNNATVAFSTLGNGGVAGNLGAAGNSANNLVFANATLLYTGGTASTDRGFSLQAGTTNTFNIVNNTLTFSNVSPATTGILIKTGAGTIVLAGTNSYSGATIVSNGTLLVKGSLPASAVSIKAGVVLGGQGQLGSSLTLASGAVLDMTVTPVSTNGLTVNGATTLNGAITVSPVYLGAALQPGTYTVLTCNGGLSGTYTLTWSDPTFQTLAAGFSLNGNKLQVTLGTTPLVTTLAASSVTATNATLNGTVNPKGLGTSTYFEYGVDTNYGTIGGLNSLGGFSSLPAANTPLTVTGVVVSNLTGPAGTIWTNLNSFPNHTNNHFESAYVWQFIASSADGTCLAAVDIGSADTGIWTSTNSGVTWTQHTNNLPLLYSQTYTALSSSADGTRLAAGNSQGIWISTNSGVTWQKSDGPGSPKGIAASADGTHLVAPISYTGSFTNLGRIWASTNSGVNWFQLPNAPLEDYYAIAGSASGTYLAAVEGGGTVWTSADGGISWTQQTNAPLVNWRAIASSADGTRLAAVTEYGGIYTSANRGGNWVLQTNASTNSIWTSITLSADGSRSAAVAINGRNQYNGTNYTNAGIYTSTDSGVSWTFQTNAPVIDTYCSIASSVDGSRLAVGTINYVWTSSGASANLSPGMTYHYQLVGFNGVGTGLGGDQTFTTGIAAPTVATAAAGGITATTVTLNGTVNPNGGATAAYFRYGLTASYGSFSPTNTLTVTNTTLPVSNLISSLSPGTLYHYQLVAGNSIGTNAGVDLTFTTIPAVPVVTTLAATPITATNATLNGTVNPGGGVTTAWFQYGLTTNYGSFTTTNALAGTNATLSVSNLISGLNPSTTYHYQLVAGNSSGTAKGVDLTLTTPNGPLLVATLAATGVTAITATLNGTVYPGGNATTAWFQYGLTTNYGTLSAITNLPASNTTLPVTSLIGNLTPNATYHFQMVASNSTGTAYGVDLSLNTPAGVLTVTTLAATGVTATNATLNGSVIPFSAPASVYFEYGPDTNYGNLGGFATLPAANAALNVPGLVVASLAGPAGSTWQQVGPSFPPWQTIASSADGTHLAAGSFNNGIYTSTNSGATWTQQTNSPTTRSQAIASSADGTRLASVIYNGSIYTSTNSGIAWTLQTNAPTTYWSAIAASVDGTRLAAGISFGGGGIYTSTNSGVSWTHQTNAPLANWFSIAASADGTRLAAAAGYGGIWTSTDSGVTWTQKTNASFQYWSAIVSSADGTRLAIGSSQTNLPVYTSTNGGATWSATTSAAQSWASLTSSADGTRLSALAATKAVYTSTNSGATWIQGNAPSSTWTCLASSADGTRLALASNGNGIWTSTGAVNALIPGQVYHFQLVGINNTATVLGGDLTFTPTVILPLATTRSATEVGSSNARLNASVNPQGLAATAWFQYGTSTNYGSLTAPVNLPGTNITLLFSNLISSLAPGTTYHFQVVASNSLGKSFGTEQNFNTSLVAPVATTLAASSVTTSNATLNGSVNPGNAPTTAWFEYGLTTNYGFLSGPISLPATNATLNVPGFNLSSVSFPAGVTWSKTAAPSYYWQSIAASADGTRLAVVDPVGDGIWTSTNSGGTWLKQTNASNGYWTAIASSADGTKLAAADGNGAGIWTSTNSGGTWKKQTNAPGNYWYAIASSADGTRLAAADSGGNGIWTSPDSGVTWTHQTNAPDISWVAIASSADGTRLAAVVYSGAIWTSTNSGITWNQGTAPFDNWNSIASSADGTRLSAVVNGGGIWSSTNGGLTWYQGDAPAKTWYGITASADGTRLAAASSDSIWTSTNSGVTWAPGNAPNVSYWFAIASSADGNHLTALSGANGIWTSSVTTFGVVQGTTYHFRLVATNSVGTSLGGDQTFTTPGTNASQPVAFMFNPTFSQAGGPFQLNFTNRTGLSFTVVGTTNLTLPIANWPVVGSVGESPAGSGQYQYTAPPPTNPIPVYYRVRFP